MRTETLNTYRFSAMSSTPIALAILLFLASSVAPAWAVPGDLDPTFGQGGRVFTTLSVPQFDYFYPNTESMLVQPDGKILVCGRFWEDGVSYWYGTFIVRYMPDGSLDTSFGDGGKVALIGADYPYGGDAVGADMVLQQDGKIVLIGQRTIADGIIVQRYTASGTLDTSFGNLGTASIVPGRGFPEGYSLAIQPDGKIVGAGWEYDSWWDPVNYYDAIVVFRLNTDGSSDTSFGTTGTGVVKIVNGYGQPEVLVQPDGKILVAGSLWNPWQNVPGSALIARYNPNGTPDQGFGSGGTVTKKDAYAGYIALQADGKILVTGLGPSSIVRLNPDGTPDPDFVPSGQVVPTNAGLFVTPDGRIVALGNVQDSTIPNRFSAARLNSNGSMDTGFGVGGYSTFTVTAGGTNYAYASDGAVQLDGKILITGYFGVYYTDSHEKIALLRIEGSNATIPVSVSGRVTTPEGRGITYAIVTLSDPSGASRVAMANTLGYFRFGNVITGQSYTLNVRAKRYSFQPKTIQVDEEMRDINFVPN